MIILRYEVYDLLDKKVENELLSGVMPKASFLYAKKETCGLLEDYMSEKELTFFQPIEVEVADDFMGLSIITTSAIQMIDLSLMGGRIILQNPLPEPSEN